MPKAKPLKPSEAATRPSLFTMRYEPEDRTILVPRPKTYEAAIAMARKQFKSLANQDVYLLTEDADIRQQGAVELTDDVWEYVVASIESVTVGTRANPLKQADSRKASKRPRVSTSQDAGRLPSPPPPLRPLPPLHSIPRLPSPPSRPSEKSRIVLDIECPGHRLISFKCSKSTPWVTVSDFVSRTVDKCASELRFLYDGRSVNTDLTVGESIWESEGNVSIVMIPAQLGGKPVIYIWTPAPAAISVNLSLVPQWEFSALYPVAPIQPAGFSAGVGQTVTWDVTTRADGSLLDKRTGLEVTYLFWEALADRAFKGQLPDSPPASRPPTPSSDLHEAFDPINATLSSHDSVLLKVSDMTPYLDACLKVLGLHTEARTSFITYWLPSFLRHEYAALRFVPQGSYEQAAPMTISPSPDIIVRVFMIFKGVKADELHAWTEARDRVQETVGRWRAVVGLPDDDQLQDKSLFRVLEWGGMEVDND